MPSSGPDVDTESVGIICLLNSCMHIDALQRLLVARIGKPDSLFQLYTKSPTSMFIYNNAQFFVNSISKHA